jgi:hypothetical protein
MARAAAAPTPPTPQDFKLATLNTMARSDREVLAALRQAQLDISRTLRALQFDNSTSAVIRRAQLSLAKRNIQSRMSQLWTQVGDITKARRLDAANRQIDLGKQMDAFLFAGKNIPGGAEAIEGFAESMRATAESGLDRLNQRMTGGSYTPLSDRVYKSSTAINGQLDRLVSSALAQALSAKQFADSIRDFVNPATPGGVRYAAMRLSRTEINNSAHAVAIAQVQDRPWVESMAWHLSGSHPRTDICNSIASGGPKRDGVYPKDAVPAKPHPQCFCYVVAVLPSDEDFTDALLAGDYDSWVDRYRTDSGPRTIPSASAPTKAPSTPTKAIETSASTKPALTGVRIVDHRVSAAVNAQFTEEYARKITKLDFSGEQGDRLVAQLIHQGSLTPKAANLLKGVRDLTIQEAKQHEIPSDALAFYDPTFRAIYLNKTTFSEAADQSLAKEVASDWSSKADPHAHAAENTVAHEFGHHLGTVIARNSPAETRALWDTVADSLGVSRPLGLAESDLKAWVEKHKTVIQRKVSRYGASNHHELLAEVWHEYSSHSSPREAIQKIGDEMRRIAEL